MLLTKIAEARAALLAARAMQGRARALHNNSTKDIIAEREDMAKRRLRASTQWVEDTISAAQRRGLTATSVSHYADGSVQIHFGESHAPNTQKPKGWDI